MKLLTKTSLNFISASVIFFLLGSVAMYFSVRNIIAEDLQSRLLQQQKDFLYNADQNNLTDFSSKLVFIQITDKEIEYSDDQFDSAIDQYKKSIQDKNHYTNLHFESIPIYNSLLSSAILLEPSISFILANLKNASNITAYGMTGSGSTCFGIFKSLDDIIVFKEKFIKISNHPFFIWHGEKKNYRFNRVTNSKVLENNF